MNKAYNFDVLTATLTVTAAFLRKASQYGTAEYTIVKNFRTDYPEMKIVKATRDNRNDPTRLTYAKMVAFFDLLPSGTEEEKDAKALVVAEFETIKGLSKIHKNPYKFVEDWFEAKFPNYNAIDPATCLKVKEDAKAEDQKEEKADTMGAETEEVA